MSYDIDSTLLARYFAETCSAEEKDRVSTWIEEDPARRVYIRRLRRIWETAGKRPRHRSADAAWEELARKAGLPIEAGPPFVSRPAGQGPSGVQPSHKSRSAGSSPDRRSSRDPVCRRRRRRSHATRARALWLIAVLVAVVMAVLLAGELQRDAAPEAPVLKGGEVFATERGERAAIELIDGTRVQLNVASRLTLAPGFAEGHRKVYFEGEAYFEVAKDTARPFQVRMENATVQVVGTTFDVQSYPGEEETKVAVAEGTVVLHFTKGTTALDTTVLLTRRHLGVVSSRGGLEAVRRGVDLKPYLAWMEDRLVFQDASFEEVARRLERWYNIRVEVRVRPEAVGVLNASFDGASLKGILSDIAVALRLQYEKDGGTVTFYRRKSSHASPARSIFPAK